MDIIEIVLLAVGGVVFILSFIIPDRKEANSVNTKLAEDEIRKLVSQELDSIKSHVDDVVEEAVTYAAEKTERSLERLSNEKIMAVSEYSDTVLTEIHKNHEEAVFLYDMLNNKNIDIKNTVSEVNRAIKEAEETVTSFQKLAPELLAVGKGEDNQTVKSASEEESFKAITAYKTDTAAWDGTVYDQVPGQYEAEDLQSDMTQDAGMGQNDKEMPGYNNNDKILGLFRQGKSAVEIAKELELGLGEVTLVIDLYKK